MNSISLDTSYSDLRNEHNCNVIVIMRSVESTSAPMSFNYYRDKDLPFVVKHEQVMAKTVSNHLH